MDLSPSGQPLSMRLSSVGARPHLSEWCLPGLMEDSLSPYQPFQSTELFRKKPPMPNISCWFLLLFYLFYDVSSFFFSGKIYFNVDQKGF